MQRNRYPSWETWNRPPAKSLAPARSFLCHRTALVQSAKRSRTSGSRRSELELYRSLKDTGCRRTRDLAKARRGQTGGWGIEVRMVRHIEGLQAKGRAQSLIYGEAAGDLSVKTEARKAASRISGDISIGSKIGTCRGNRTSTWSRDLGESCRIKIAAICRTLSRPDGVVDICRNSTEMVGTIVVHVRKGIVLPGGNGERCATSDMDQGCKLPVIGQD